MSTQTTARPLTMALSKGRIFEETLPLLEAAGIQVSEDPEKSRKLIIGTSNPNLAVAVKNGFDYPAAVRQGARLRVATKYVTAAREHFAAKGVYVDLIKLYGSMELAPLVGLADAIVDLVSTGNTLRANDLVAVEDIMPISSRLIVNRAALKTRHAELQPLLDAFEVASRKAVA